MNNVLEVLDIPESEKLKMCTKQDAIMDLVKQLILHYLKLFTCNKMSGNAAKTAIDICNAAKDTSDNNIDKDKHNAIDEKFKLFQKT